MEEVGQQWRRWGSNGGGGAAWDLLSSSLSKAVFCSRRTSFTLGLDGWGLGAERSEGGVVCVCVCVCARLTRGCVSMAFRMSKLRQIPSGAHTAARDTFE